MTFRKWDIIRFALSKQINSLKDFREILFSYNETYRNKWNLYGLAFYANQIIDQDDRPKLLQTMGRIAKLALELPELIPHPIPLMKQGQPSVLTLSQMQIACLLANAFFCTFPRRNDTRRNAEYGTYPSIHFNRLFAGNKDRECEGPQIAKLHGIFHYFEQVTNTRPTGHVTFHRQVVPNVELPDWKVLLDTPLCGMGVRSDGMIEDEGKDMVQVDFANKMIGGGVLGHVSRSEYIGKTCNSIAASQGAVQEEIRFIINPELIVTRLFVEELDDNESLSMIGAQRFSNYRGYASTFEWAGPHVDQLPKDNQGRIKTEIVGIDAVRFPPNQVDDQYRRNYLIRELNKAYCGFVQSIVTCHERPPQIATGNWGCGAFNGDKQLKALIQLIATAAARRDLVYFTFGDAKFADDLRGLYQSLKAMDVSAGTVLSVVTLTILRGLIYQAYTGQLYDWVAKYNADVVRKFDGPDMTLFDYVTERLTNG
ncbi:hypothetical protein HK097_001509 [Rhizophlyctis rosea]|uniref:poly(ADP-ribose) glycohydrolase n=1 Tax=Rhizophlyctis rosea TaxID=64517 RepID=A0AAD5SRI2_9FUNG|nr:hypothetical protein HK097_001509 [Rhizophlyctis rosea]